MFQKGTLTLNLFKLLIHKKKHNQAWHTDSNIFLCKIAKHWKMINGKW